ncbi:hypothetical protein RCH22_001523 [Cryobacterium psychrotolerans]|nr:hypothetical protein [Cryobacterium psychrotolerans]
MIAATFFGAEFLDALRGLPEEHVRGDGGTQDPDDQTEVRRGELDLPADEATGNVGPIYVGNEENTDVDQKNHAQPFEDPADHREGPRRHCHNNGDTGDRGPHKRGSRVQQVHALTDRVQVRGQVQTIRNDQQGQKNPDRNPESAAKASTDQRAKALPGG